MQITMSVEMICKNSILVEINPNISWVKCLLLLTEIVQELVNIMLTAQGNSHISSKLLRETILTNKKELLRIMYKVKNIK